MSSFQSAFNMIISLQGRDMDLYVLNQVAPKVSVKAAVSNYHTDPAGPESLTGDGRQFVITSGDAQKALGRAPKKGDRMEDSELGKMTIVSVKVLPGLGGGIIGYRLRVE